MTDYVELHCHSNFSLLDGADHPETLVQRAHDLGMSALALTDHHAVYGVVRFYNACQSLNIHPILGAELTLEDGHHLTLLAKDHRGWQHICRWITIAQHHAPKGEAFLPESYLSQHNEGVIVLSGCHHGKIAQALLQQDDDRANEIAGRYLEWFGPDAFYLEIQQHYRPDDSYLINQLATLSRETGIPLVATNNVHYATADRHRLQDVLVCIRHQIALDDAHGLLRPNQEFYLKSPEQMGYLFREYPEAIANTVHIAHQCSVDLTMGLQSLPHYPTPDEIPALHYLSQLCETRVNHMDTEAIQRLDHELKIIQQAGLANYFLIVWDIVQFAKDHDIRCQGRGSAANSLVAYLLGITSVNPLEHHLVFERFLSAERQLTPDIDIDFDANRREEVIQYIYQRYGYEHVAMACTLITFRHRSAIRDVGKALGLSPHLITYITDKQEQDAQSITDLADDLPDASQPLYQLQALCEQIKGFPRHLGIHNGGMVITGDPLSHRVPTEPATMDNRYVVQWDKDSLEAVGLVKIDILGLRMLSAISETVDHIQTQYDQSIDLDKLPFDDPTIYQMISRADTIGIFQVESRAQQQILPRLQPRTFADLIVSISLIRPGPVQGNMVHPYLRRRLGEEPIQYPHPSLEPILAETLGVILFQEQVLKVAHVLAGFTHGQGELLRRALGNKQAKHLVQQFRDEFIQGAMQQGVEISIAEDVFAKLAGFASYSFPKSHAAAFAVLVYQSAWLKYYYPTAFYVALLNNQPMGFWQPAVLVNDAERHGIQTLLVDIHRSQGQCTFEDGHIRLGFNYIPHWREAYTEMVLDARQQQPFMDLKDFCQRTRLPRRMIQQLIMVGAMPSWGLERRQLLWRLARLDYTAPTLALVYPDDSISLPDLTLPETLATEYEILGLSLINHPMALYREHLGNDRVLNSEQVQTIETGHYIRVAGLLVIRQSPRTAKGVTFLTLEDEFGMMNIVLKPPLADTYKQLIKQAALLQVEGYIEQCYGVVNIVATNLSQLKY